MRQYNIPRNESKNQPESSTEAKLSPGLFCEYKLYKEKTGIVLTWLIENGDGGLKDSSSLLVKDYVHLAQIIGRKAVGVPSMIIASLLSAIKKRKKITNFFKAAGPSDSSSTDVTTTSHEYFSAACV